MQLTQFTDYSLRALIYIAIKKIHAPLMTLLQLMLFHTII